MELFIYGDPRLLSGGEADTRDCRALYEREAATVAGSGVRTSTLEATRPAKPEDVTMFSSVVSTGQALHKGKGSYHCHIGHNKFLVDDQWPSAGVELETICVKKDRTFANRMVDELKSNWFHFERDGSLDDGCGGEYGYELVTEPLPPRVYRDPRTWVGLENLICPWLESFDYSCTGLHVHVGLNQFSDFDLPLENRKSRMFLGKLMSLLIYFSVVDASFVDRVCLRKQGRYCATPGGGLLFEGTSRLADGKMTGYEFVDLCVGKLVKQDVRSWSNCVSSLDDRLGNSGFLPDFCQTNMNGTVAHGTEVNTEHTYTIEFRRGKGTTHSLSIHRMVELMTMIVRYAGKCCRNPGDTVSSKAFYEFVHDNTTSMPLRRLVEKATTAA